jgi:hypothetical protein
MFHTTMENVVRETHEHGTGDNALLRAKERTAMRIKSGGQARLENGVRISECLF